MSLNLYANQQMMNKDMKKKFTKTFDLSQIAEDPMDSYLDTLGLWKKRIARDGSCLFRAVAEQIYPCQLHHERVRQECVRYMADHKDDFAKYISTISYEDYLEAMKNTLEYAGQLEIAAMSKLYNRDFIIYQHPDQPGVDVTQNGFEKKIYLCYSYNNHFDAIFTKAHRDNLALIQSFVYEILYDKVFGSGEQVSVARRLLRKSDTIYPKEYMRGSDDGEYDDEDDSDEREIHSSDDIDSERDLESLDYEVCETGQNSILMTSESNSSEVATTDQLSENAESTDQNNNDTSKSVPKLYKKDDVFSISSSSFSLSDKSAIQKMPLPYKVAKSLDPVIYRNTAFDAWQAAKKEYEELVNQKAIAILQTGDKCLVKLNNNYSEKWNLAYVQNIQQNIANVFVIELNENHCVGIENLKPYKSGGGDGQMMHHGNNGYYHNGGNGGSMFHVSSVQNVHKLVQSVNVQFSKIFINTDNKRRNVKKKQQFNSMKKSSSFHAFSTELPTLIEVEEQLAEHPFHYHDQHYGYLNNHHNQPMYHLPHHQQQHSLPPPMAYPPQPQNGNHMGNQFAYHNGSYTSLPHTQFNDLNDPNSKGKLSNSLSANNLNQYSSMPTNLQGPVNGNNNLSNSSSNLNTSNNNKNRRQRYPQNNNMNFSTNFSGPFNNGMKQHPQQQQPWTNNSFQSSTMGPHSNGFMHPSSGPSLLHPQMSNGPQHLNNCNQQQGFNGPLGPQPLGPNQTFMQPPPSLGQLHPPNGPMQPPFMHQGPPPPHPHMGPMGPMNHPASSGHPGAPRPNFFNPISSFMFGPPPPQPNMQSSNQSHMGNMNSQQPHSDQGYYFPSANGNNSSNQTQSNSHKNNQRLPSQRNDNKGDSNAKSNGVGYQQVPQHNSSSQSSSTNLLSMPPPTTTVSTSTELNQPPLQNTSNYLLMPAPQNNQSVSSNAANNTTNSSSSSATNVPSTTSAVTTTSTSSGTSSTATSNNNMTRSHSYHAGVSQQSYETSNSNSSNVYVDVYHNNNNQQSNNNNNGSTGTSNPNVPNILPGTVNPHSTLLMQANGANTNSNGSIGHNSGLDNVYGSNNFHSYDSQYTRFDNNGFVSSNQSGLIGEDDLNNNNSSNLTDSQRQNNLWNKSNKLTRNQNNFFNDMAYPENNTNLMNTNGQNNSQYYTNCFVVNIDGPINFNATHSLLDDGSDLPISDVNTIRFFYNLGIEYYRLNLATPYNTQQAPNYYAPATAATTTTAPNQQTNQTSSSGQNPSSVSSNTLGTSLNTTSNKLKDSNNDNQTNGVTSNIPNSNSSSSNHQQQVVPQHNSNSKPLIQHQYSSRRVIH